MNSDSEYYTYMKDGFTWMLGLISVHWLSDLLQSLSHLLHPTVIAAVITGLFVFAARMAEIRFNSTWKDRALEAEKRLEERGHHVSHHYQI